MQIDIGSEHYCFSNTVFRAHCLVDMQKHLRSNVPQLFDYLTLVQFCVNK